MMCNFLFYDVLSGGSRQRQRPRAGGSKRLSQTNGLATGVELAVADKDHASCVLKEMSVAAEALRRNNKRRAQSTRGGPSKRRNVEARERGKLVLCWSA
jgi:hypothetical protein